MNQEKKQELRTQNQNKALHKFCAEVAKECLDKGITYKVLIENLGVEPNAENIKDIFRAIGKTLFNKDRTSQMTISELSQVTERVIPILASKGIETPFPSEEIVRMEMELAQNSLNYNQRK